MNRRTVSVFALFAAFISSVAMPVLAAETMEMKSLYERLGGEPAVTAVVDEFVARAASNPAVNFTRKGTSREWQATPENVAKLKKHLVQFVCSVAGGPQTYEGRDMKTVHEGMQITNAQFDAIAGDLQGALAKFNVPQKEQDELLGAVGTLRGQIVEEAPAY